MTPNNNIMILPFYNDLNKQSRYKKEALGVNYQLFSPINYILPFQFNIPANYSINYIQLIDCEESEYNSTFDSGNILFFTGLSTAISIAALPFAKRKLGLTVLYAENPTANIYEWHSYKYNGATINNTDWNNLSNWSSITSFHEDIITSNDISINSFNGYYALVNKGVSQLDINKRGQCYLKIALQLQNSATLLFYYSEVFSFTNLTADCIKIEYWNENNFYAGDKIILYAQDTYKNKLYIQSNINKPTYEFTENGTEKDGYLNIESIISKKSYNFTFPAPEFLCDAIRLIGMHDNIFLTYEGETYRLNRFIPDPKWENTAFLANVNVNFECNTVFKAINKATVEQNISSLWILENGYWFDSGTWQDSQTWID